MWKFWIELIQLVWRQSPLHHSCVGPVMCVVCLTTESQNLCFMANSALEGENAMDKNCASKMYWRDTWRMWISTPKLGRKMQWTESSDNQWSITTLPLPNRIVYQAAHNKKHTPTTDGLKCNSCSRLCRSNAGLVVHQRSYSTYPFLSQHRLPWTADDE